MRMMVTGGCGFIGSHLAEHLISAGHEVVVIDNLFSGSRQNIEHLDGLKGFEFAEADIRNLDEIKPYFDGVNYVFHLAGLADIVPSIEKPVEYYEVNVTGTLNVLTCASAAGASKFLYAASSSSYGIPDFYPTPETSPIAPQYPYALTKYMGEELVMHWSKVYGMHGISLRLFNVYGPRSRTSGAYGAVLGVFLAQKLNNQPFTIVGDGAQSRDFTYVSDVVDAFVTAANSGIASDFMNVGSGNHYSINYLVELLGGGEINWLPKRPAEPNCTFADIKKIQRLLGWFPKVSIQDGLRIMVENIEWWKDAPVWTPSKIEVATKTWFKYLK